MVVRIVERRTLPLKEIIPPDPSDRLRSVVNKDALTALARSVSAEGLLEDILVTDDGKPELVAGYRRYLACKMAGVTEVPVTVVELDDDLDRHMVEMSENLCRENLDDVDLALALSKAKGLYEAKYPETKHGGDRSKPRNSEVASFAEFISGLLGCGASRIHDLLNRAEAYEQHPGWAEAVRKDQMTPSSVTRLWRRKNRGRQGKRPRGFHSAFRAKNVAGTETCRISLLVVPDDGDRKKAAAMEKAIAAWWKTTSQGKAERGVGNQSP